MQNIFLFLDRPDSRSTDEESMHPGINQPKIVKSNSSSRVIGKTPLHQRALNERGRLGRTSEAELNDSNGTHTLPRTTGIVKSKSTITANKRPTRSLSAGGSQEFFGKNSVYSANQRGARNLSAGTRTPVTTRAATGKNTWNGPNVGQRQRLRGNLFQADLFNDKSMENGDKAKTYNVAELTDIDLATLIRTALELPSDEDKISHIELALKQLEEKQVRRNSTDAHSVSLPYSSNSAESSPMHSKSVNIRKRRDNGSTKIPKPVFY